MKYYSSNAIKTPYIPNDENRSVWAQYTILLMIMHLNLELSLWMT